MRKKQGTGLEHMTTTTTLLLRTEMFIRFYSTWDLDTNMFFLLPTIYFERIKRFPPMKSDVMIGFSWLLWTLELEIEYET